MSQDVISTKDVPVIGDDGKPKLDSNGKPVINKKPMAGEAIEQSMFRDVGQQLPTADKILPGIQSIPTCGRKQEWYPVRIESALFKGRFLVRTSINSVYKRMATATEVKASSKDLTESVWKQRVVIQDVLTEMTRSILTIGRELCGSL